MSNHRSGDVANGHILTPTGWVPLTSKLAPGPQGWRPGDVVNGHAFTGETWVPVFAVHPSASAEDPSTAKGSGLPTGLAVTLIVLASIFGQCGVGFVAALVAGTESDQPSNNGPSEVAAAKPSGERSMHGTWFMKIDADRTVRLEMGGSLSVRDSKKNAPAGQTDIVVQTFGVITATNISGGRAIDEGWDNTGLEVFVPIAACPDWRNLKPQGSHCTRDPVSFNIPSLDIDESADIDLRGSQVVATVPTGQAKTVIDAMLGDEAVVVQADRVYGGADLGRLKPACALPSGGRWITYFTEDAAVAACATEIK